MDKRRRKDDGTFPVKLYVWNRREILISTNYSSVEENFTNGEYNKREPNFRAKNAALRNMLSALVNEMIVLESSGRLAGMGDKALKDHLRSVLFPGRGGYSLELHLSLLPNKYPYLQQLTNPPFNVKQTKYAEYFCINISAIQNIAVSLQRKQR